MACKCSLIFRIGVLHQIGTSERMSSGSTAPCPKNLKIFGHALTTHCIPSTDLHLDPLPIYANKCAHTSFFSHPGFDPVHSIYQLNGGYLIRIHSDFSDFDGGSGVPNTL